MFNAHITYRLVLLLSKISQCFYKNYYIYENITHEILNLMNKKGKRKKVFDDVFLLPFKRMKRICEGRFIGRKRPRNKQELSNATVMSPA